MPTYEYLCSDCQNAWEEIQKISEAPIEVCPRCGKHTAKRQISAGNFILKGGGWYADLYASSKKSTPETKTDASASSSTSTSKASTDASSSSTASASSGSSGSSGTSAPSGGASKT